jgi:hypothetical protein
MTLTEFKNEFNIHYNAIASQSAPGLDDYEISVFLTKAQEELIKNYYNPDGNKYKEGFESSEKRRVDLKELVKSDTSTTIITSFDGLSSDSKFFVIPNDVFLLIYETAILDTGDCNNGKQVNVVAKTHDEFNVQYDNPFKNPDSSTVWRLNISKLGNDKVVELICPFDITSYKFRYIKFPKPIILSDLNTTFPSEGLSIDGITTQTECELDPGVHKEILDRAVELALRDYKPSNLESKIQLDQRNE